MYTPKLEHRSTIVPGSEFPVEGEVGGGGGGFTETDLILLDVTNADRQARVYTCVQAALTVRDQPREKGTHYGRMSQGPVEERNCELFAFAVESL